MYKKPAFLKHFLLGLLFCLCIGCTTLASKQQIKPQQDIQKTVFDVSQQRYIQIDDLVDQLAESKIILIGEKHTEKKHHQAQLRLITMLEERSLISSIALEMFPSTAQTDLNRAQTVIRRQPAISDHEIAAQLDWDSKWDWTQYRTLITYLSRSNINIYGANLSREEINILLQGAYPLLGEKSTTTKVKQAIRTLIAESHAIDHSDPLIDRLVEIQQFKDRRMAETLLKNNKPILFIGGLHHIRKSIGVPLHLAEYLESHYKVIAMVESLSDIEMNDADYIWVL
ncbi:hypothetical protein FHQ26_00840 [Testudinibacter sp. TR-2022]|uniref:ChaN family lipoprotein n=1 Tax=Testudinibacter sp. TR-2022 TaxID=2585029 RepID=UPI001118B4A9|nr:ChaN family lipoprotein [Testudinibacter sp. TR-2022]TNH04767.1 hypothetical protein FHQ22_03365 [Pasteurellaceae bacterium Phil31]TNH08629.1 hypothetical protein FHQ25_09220 [Testudinibacter sp. TR-2022]TNH12959.1 hypothetical protein FHQ26_00840 [Testudinibacter sp. TR-2022]TNH13432.1 hypothetical protein FIA56_07535 [Testudinibacter sp. TR-2022]TNH13661.1 hypothetical protein FHQ23_11765 [Testudinibacter sp. TR-2022]